MSKHKPIITKDGNKTTRLVEYQEDRYVIRYSKYYVFDDASKSKPSTYQISLENRELVDKYLTVYLKDNMYRNGKTFYNILSIKHYKITVRKTFERIKEEVVFI